MSSNGTNGDLPTDVTDQLLATMAEDVLQLLPHLEARGNDAREAAASRLADRARIESDEMTRILEGQRNRVLRTLQKTESTGQLELFKVADERKQVEDNMRYWKKWLEDVEGDLESEPERIKKFYEVHTTRIEPVGIVYLWPA